MVQGRSRRPARRRAVIALVLAASLTATVIGVQPVWAMTFTVNSTADEAAEMARTFNAMLDRLEAVFRREREFIVDASHELRGPLTISLGNLGLLGHAVTDTEERRRTVALVCDELERMGRIVGDLHLLLILDIGLPGRGGFENVIETLRGFGYRLRT
ncbi:histidine kinase dimerization/phospho-acceptor domain-containing protein [Phytohabitans sp. ZYX-F-186]|uniref:histidine kinase n=1 Tax=Phytohabitans maris TaxID=3071409 RepID=A0ABU0ZBT2_9ACTN|nr:histidine kinase dimerization/phospho-acceptor domain-containing protein [Phytohabitans sp. ZYX-F-186]MDQ7904448.1 histidine kinase dimerization/phospho-acceptor domain-containing protein [Phytohabitans sp. ZYX-F-186]